MYFDYSIFAVDRQDSADWSFKARRYDSVRGATEESQSEDSDSEEEDMSDLITDYAKSGENINFGEPFVKKIILSSIFGLKLSEDSRKEWLFIQKERIRTFALNLPAFQQLSENDQQVLLLENLGSLVCLFGTIFFIRKSEYGNHIKPFIGKSKI